MSTYQDRAHYLPPREQTYVHLADVRPNYGPCPTCGVPEDHYCDPGCPLADPYDHGRALLSEMRRCWSCLRRDDDGDRLLVLPGSGVIHAERGRTGVARCGQARVPRAHLFRMPWAGQSDWHW